MGNGNTSSHRWQPDRKITAEQRATYWETKALQYKAERDHLEKVNTKLAEHIAKVERDLSIFLFHSGVVYTNAGSTPLLHPLDPTVDSSPEERHE